MKRRLLFVDDEENVLDGLRRMLRSTSAQWDMVFVDSGEKALAAMEKAPFDVVIADMRMPGMDGAQLLGEVQRRYPDTARIILSGYAEKESVLRTVGPTHQYLAKPCDQDMMINVIERVLGLRTLLASEGLRRLVSGLKTLPTPSAVYFELLEELDSPEGSAAAVAEIIAGDIALTSQILRLVNSAYFALPTKATTPLQAVQLLGLETIKSVVLSAGVFSQYLGDKELASTLETLNRRCLAIGSVAKAIAEAENLDSFVAEHARCAGVLSHIGTLLLVATWPSKFRKVVSFLEKTAVADTGAGQQAIGIAEAEQQVFHADHAALGAYLLGLWGFSGPIIEAVAYHHEPRRSHCPEVNALTAVHAAQYLTREDRAEMDPREMAVPSLDREYLAEVGVLDRLPAWEEIAGSFKQERVA
ncbi:MAG: HDOD domain-containing protein [Rhodospirillales bacterium]